jgi:hypothetical protein
MVSQQFCLMPQYCFSNGVNFANAADGTRMVVASYPGSPSARPSRSCHQQRTTTHPRVCEPRVAPLLDAFPVDFVVAAVASVASRGAAERRQQGPCISMEHNCNRGRAAGDAVAGLVRGGGGVGDGSLAALEGEGLAAAPRAKAARPSGDGCVGDASMTAGCWSGEASSMASMAAAYCEHDHTPSDQILVVARQAPQSLASGWRRGRASLL